MLRHSLIKFAVSNWLVFVVIVFVSLACKKGSSPEESKVFDEARTAFFNNLMDPADVTIQLQSISAEFIPDLLNDPKHYQMYAKDKVIAAANMGVYIADLNYSIAYGQKEIAKEYFQAAYQLSKTIEIEKGTLAFLIKRYEDNLERNDSVKNIVNGLWSTSLRDMQGTKQERLAGIARAAYQIENLHIALGLLKLYVRQDSLEETRSIHSVPLLKLVVSQRANVEIIYRFLKSFSDPLNPDKNPNYLYYLNAFEELIEHFKKLEESQSSSVNNLDILELRDRVDVVRNKMISIE